MKWIPSPSAVRDHIETLVNGQDCNAHPDPRYMPAGMQPGRPGRCAVIHGALLFAALATGASAQNQVWIRQLGSVGADYAWAAASDGSGGVYVGGNTSDSLGGPNVGNDDLWLARYDSAGNQAWIRQVGSNRGDYPTAAAPDGSGGVYVCGHTEGSFGGPSAGNYDVWLVRYDSAGNQAWIRQFGSSGADEAYAAAPDGAGGVYLSGFTFGSLSGQSAGVHDVWIARYDSAGNRIWIRQFGTSSYDQAFAATPDGAGGMYVGGLTEGSLGGPNAGGSDGWLARYDSAGNRTWIRQFGSSGQDFAYAAAPDASGGVFVGGATTSNLGGPNAGSDDVWLARYDDAGNRTWIRQFGSSGVEYVWTASPDGSGGVFVGGLTRSNLGGPNAGGFDAWLARYGSAGNQDWIQQIGTADDDEVRRSATDGSGGVFVCGKTLGSLGGPNMGGEDVWLARYDGGFTASRYCSPAVPNSSGQSGALIANGSNLAVSNNLTVVAGRLPQNSFGYLLTSQTQGLINQPGGSLGVLCLGGSIGRYTGAGQIQNTGSLGYFALVLDLHQTPQPTGFVSIVGGQTWNFQAWHRDAVGGVAVSNFTDAVAIPFQ
jgi:hypothetical protein